MDAREFRRRLREVADWMADYAEEVGTFPVTPPVRPGDVRAGLPVSAPEEGEPFEAIWDDFARAIVPAMTHWNHPRWFAYFPANTSPPSVLAEMATAVIGAQCMSWETSPAATELEQAVMEWLRGLLALPPSWRGVIQDSASSSTLVALLSARERATGFSFQTAGAAAPDAARLTTYASTQAHSSVDKGVKIAGLGLDRLRRIPVDRAFAMNPAALEEAIEADEAAGLRPAAAVACVGTTSSAASDPLRPIGEICRRHGVWLHVDAAYAGTACLLPEHRGLLDGVELADSFVFNPHKWMFTNFDCSAYFVREVEPLLRTLAMTPEYLRTDHDEAAANLRDWGIPLGRRFRALKLWFVLRSYGAEGIRERVRRHVTWASEFASWVEAARNFELAAPPSLGLVCFRWRPPERPAGDPALDEANEALLRAVNATGRVHLTHTRLDGRYVIRMCVGQLRTSREDVEEAWHLFQSHAPAAAERS